MAAAETFLRDVRVGLRVLKKERAFCALAIVVIALGICGVTTMFSVVNGIMLRGFSFPNAGRMMDVNFIDPTSATFFGVNARMFGMDYEDTAASQKSFEMLAAYLSGSTVNMTVDRQPRRYTGAYVTPDFMRILGVRPMSGRDFVDTDNKPGAPKVAIIGYAIWQRDFGGSLRILGEAVRINGAPATIIGVMPRGFSFPTNDELWIPLYSEFPLRPRNDTRANAPAVLGLLRQGVSPEQAQAEITTFARRLAAAYPDTNKQFNAGRVEPLIKAYTSPPLRGTLLTMLGFCVGVLLIACANVMNMQFARATLRAKELAIRSSLGATRTRIIRQMLTESLVLASGAAVVGTALAYLSIDWFAATLRNMDNPPPSWMTIELDGPALLVTIGATVTAALASGLLPAWMASRANAVAVLRDGGRGATGRGVRVVTGGLVVAQIVVTCILLIGSLLQVRSILAQQAVDYGYDMGGILSARMGLMDADYPQPESRKLFFDRLLRELRNSPQFERVAFTSRMRMLYSGNSPIEIEGRVYKDRRDRPNTNLEQVSAGYFDLLGAKFIEGRDFRDDDLDAKLPVAIVNAAFARKHFGSESALGRRFRTGDGTGASQYGPWRTIVGVVRNVRMIGPVNVPNIDESGYYVPFYSVAAGPVPPEPVAAQFATVLVKPHASQRPDALAAALRTEVNKVDPNLPLYFVGTPRQHLDGAMAAFRIIATMFSIFGIVAVVLAAAGIYGVMSFAVSQRTQEFGVRMALGADFRRIVVMVLAQGSRQLVVGLGLGLALAFAVATAARDAIAIMLFNVSPRDPVTYATVLALVTLVSLVALFMPARRATRVDPMVALRAE